MKDYGINASIWYPFKSYENRECFEVSEKVLSELKGLPENIYKEIEKRKGEKFDQEDLESLIKKICDQNEYEQHSDLIFSVFKENASEVSEVEILPEKINAGLVKSIGESFNYDGTEQQTYRPGFRTQKISYDAEKTFRHAIKTCVGGVSNFAFNGKPIVNGEDLSRVKPILKELFIEIMGLLIDEGSLMEESRKNSLSSSTTHSPKKTILANTADGEK